MSLVCVRKTLTIVRHLPSVLPTCHWRIVSVHRTSLKRLHNVLVAIINVSGRPQNALSDALALANRSQNGQVQLG